MSIRRNSILGILLAIGIVCLYLFRNEVVPLVHTAVNNVYISHLDTTDSQAMAKFIDQYKKALIRSRKYSTSEINRTIDNAQKLLKQEKLAISAGYNLLGNLVGYMAVDLKRGFCILYYTFYTDIEFSKIYTILLQDVEAVCKKSGLKTLVIPIISPEILSSPISPEHIPFASMGSDYQSRNIEKAIIQVLQNLGYQPLQGWAKFTQEFKGLFLGSYKYDSAWSKNL